VSAAGVATFLQGLVAGFVKQGQAGFRQVAFVGNLPFVVGFDEHRAGQPQQCGNAARKSLFGLAFGSTPATSDSAWSMVMRCLRAP
jgi:hypothetical protein